MKLDLETKNKEQEKIKEYLEENATESLADKINNGVQINKDGQLLVMRKTLDSFMQFATNKAKELAEKNSNYACVDDDIVYGWAMHYFEEDSIEGKLYNIDGTEYSVKPKTTVKKQTKIAETKPIVKEPLKPKDNQMSIFDILGLDNNDVEEEPEVEKVAEEIDEDIEVDKPAEVVEETKPVIVNATNVAERKTPYSYYEKYKKVVAEHIDAIVFIRLGDFYEVFDKCAITAAEILELTLTSKEVGEPKRVALAGIPYHAKDVYFNKLISKGYTVCVIENDNVDILGQEEDEEEEFDLTEEEMREFDGDINDCGLTIDEDPPPTYSYQAKPLIQTVEWLNKIFAQKLEVRK